MARTQPLRVTVEGDLPDEVLKTIVSAVQDAVRKKVATIDLLDGWCETPPDDTSAESKDKPVAADDESTEDVLGGVITNGLVYWPPER